MKFTFHSKNQEDTKWYESFYLSENRQYSIGIEQMLFGRVRIQFMHRLEPVPKDAEFPDDFRDWWVIREWVTYEPMVFTLFMTNLFDLCEGIPDFLEGGDWKVAASYLPKKEEKYLEDQVEYREYCVLPQSKSNKKK